ncbi:hypothetical protein FOL47_007246 [Perkinsus chesapeaki]|uniref:Adenylyl/guanylyl cyclase n=1 Tax=Perkinsus chesapeaki TaxID=330153 RepID=A0A7J6LLZ0_PERCH|nr:hypothetical protein FOL47_007246 [Perkinsus chesapeaki]
MVELTINSIIQDEWVGMRYKWSFFFWLDCVATASLIPDIGWFTAFLADLYDMGDSGSQGGGGGQSGVARAGRASRAGTRAGRIVRLVRLVRLLRVVNLTKLFRRNGKRSELDDQEEVSPFAARSNSMAATEVAPVEPGANKQQRIEASRLGKMLSEQTTRRVIIGVLSMMLVLPLIELTETNLAYEAGLEQLFWAGRSVCGSAVDFIARAQGLSASSSTCNGSLDLADFTLEGWQFMIYEYSQVSRSSEGLDAKVNEPLLWLEIPDLTADPPGRIKSITYTPPMCRAPDSPCADLMVSAKFLDRKRKQDEAKMSMLQTSMIVVLLGLGAMLFSSDTQKVVIAPIEKMVNIVKQLADDPLRKPEVEQDEQDLDDSDGSENGHADDHEGSSDRHSRKKGRKSKKVSSATRDKEMETDMLENTILKIGGLLRVGFGQAGAQIIGKNMSQSSGNSSGLNFMLPGRRVEGVYAYCDIRKFGGTTDCLLEEVMVFVNKIARIVHLCADEWEGAANKNLGDSFLLTWLLPQDDTELSEMMLLSSKGKTRGTEARISTAAATKDATGLANPSTTMESLSSFAGLERSVKKKQDWQDLAEKALLGCIKIVAEIRRAGDLRAYAKHPKLIPKFGLAYQVDAGVALHCGWSIEGAIGSEQKIDATYIGFHVSAAYSLVRSTPLYGVNILITGAVMEHLGGKVRERCRLVDEVMIGEVGKEPKTEMKYELYTFDMNNNIPDIPDNHLLGKIILPAEVPDSELAENTLEYLFEVDKDIQLVQEGFTLDFRTLWRQAYHFYNYGSWQKAKQMFEKCDSMLPNGDGPSRALIKYMSEYNFEKPEKLKGITPHLKCAVY